MSQEYTSLNLNRNDSFDLELESLVTSDDLSTGTPSDRGLSPIEPGEFDSDNAIVDPSQSHSRSFSVSTIGDWYNLAASHDPNVGTRLEKHKNLSYFHGLALVIGLQIGSGIFASPNQVNEHVGSVGASLIIWAVSGVLAWTGASSYAELGSAIPLNGSSQVYLNHIFGPLPSFLFCWTALIILKPGSAAIISIIFAEYLGKGIGGTFASSFWVQKAIAIAGIFSITGLNCISTKLGAHAGSVFLVIKVSMLLAIAIIGIVNLAIKTSRGALLDLSQGGIFAGSSKYIGDYAIALYAGLWAYDGWDNVNFVSAEMRNARRDIPRVMNTAMPVVIVAYLATNIAYYSVLSEDQIETSASVALTYAQAMFKGRIAPMIFAFMISVSCIGALNATIFASARLVYSSAEEGFLPAYFAELSAARHTPVHAFLLQAFMSTIFIIVGEFDSLLTFYGLAGYSFYFLTVFGVILLRFKQPTLERPYKTFIITPILFCCVALFLISRTLFEKPLQSLFVVLFQLVGLAIYYVVRPRPRWMLSFTEKLMFWRRPSNEGYERTGS